MKSHQLLSYAHWAMGSCLAISLIIAYVIYGSSLELGIGVLVTLHIGLILFPGVFKVAYVTRLTALKQLGRSVD